MYTLARRAGGISRSNVRPGTANAALACPHSQPQHTPSSARMSQLSRVVNPDGGEQKTKYRIGKIYAKHRHTVEPFGDLLSKGSEQMAIDWEKQAPVREFKDKVKDKDSAFKGLIHRLYMKKYHQAKESDFGDLQNLGKGELEQLRIAAEQEGIVKEGEEKWVWESGRKKTAAVKEKEAKLEGLRRLAFHLQSGVVKRRHRRIHVLNEEVMEKALKNVDLSEYEGCQLIDMNPGFGGPSRILQEKVKPSRHILLEPNEAFHPHLKQEFLDNPPLPAAKCTTTIHSLDGYDWTTIEKLIENKVLEPKVVPPEEGVNTNLLFVGNLALPGADGERLATQLVESIPKMSWLQRYGRVRMIFWIQDAVKLRILPRYVRDRQRTGLIGELTADIQELAGHSYWHDDSEWYQQFKEALAKLQEYLKEIDEQAAKAPPPLPSDEASTTIPEKPARVRVLAPSTIRNSSFNTKDRETFLSVEVRNKLEALYTNPNHTPWTPELEHPPWYYDDPTTGATKPPPILHPDHAPRIRPSGRAVPVPKPDHVPTLLTKKCLRRIPFPNEFLLHNGNNEYFDAYQLYQAYTHQKSLDAQLQSWTAEVEVPPGIEVEPEDPTVKKTSRRNPEGQYLDTETAKALGYKKPSMAKVGVLQRRIAAELGDVPDADARTFAYLRAIGPASKRKAAMYEMLKEEIDVINSPKEQRILQWHKQTFEPVLTEPEDFYTQEPLALLDITPRILPSWLRPEGDTKLALSRWELFNHLVRNLYAVRTSTLAQGVETIAPGMDKMLDQLPEIDRTKKTRALSVYDLLKIAERYEAWPFRNSEAVYEDGLVALAESTKQENKAGEAKGMMRRGGVF